MLAEATLRLESVTSSASLESQILGAWAAGVSRTVLLASLDEKPNEEEVCRFEGAISRRLAREPIPYITGRCEFFGLELEVSPAVLVPRPETETLVEAFVREEPNLPPGPIADLGTGSGCILAAALANTTRLGIGTDISSEALRVAARNLRQLRLIERALLVKANWLECFQCASLAAVLCNPPYVAWDDPYLEPAVRQWEPPLSLFAGPTGYEFIEITLTRASQVLVPGGALLMEIGYGQAHEATRLASGWKRVYLEKDLAGTERVLVAFK